MARQQVRDMIESAEREVHRIRGHHDRATQIRTEAEQSAGQLL